MSSPAQPSPYIRKAARRTPRPAYPAAGSAWPTRTRPSRTHRPQLYELEYTATHDQSSRGRVGSLEKWLFRRRGLLGGLGLLHPALLSPENEAFQLHEGRLHHHRENEPEEQADDEIGQVVLEHLEEREVLGLLEVVAVAHDHNVVDEVGPERYLGDDAEEASVEQCGDDIDYADCGRQQYQGDGDSEGDLRQAQVQAVLELAPLGADNSGIGDEHEEQDDCKPNQIDGVYHVLPHHQKLLSLHQQRLGMAINEILLLVGFHCLLQLVVVLEEFEVLEPHHKSEQVGRAPAPRLHVQLEEVRVEPEEDIADVGHRDVVLAVRFDEVVDDGADDHEDHGYYGRARESGVEANHHQTHCEQLDVVREVPCPRQARELVPHVVDEEDVLPHAVARLHETLYLRPERSSSGMGEDLVPYQDGGDVGRVEPQQSVHHSHQIDHHIVLLELSEEDIAQEEPTQIEEDVDREERSQGYHRYGLVELVLKGDPVGTIHHSYRHRMPEHYPKQTDTANTIKERQ